MSKKAKVSARERKNRLILAARQASRVESLDVAMSPGSDDSRCEAIGSRKHDAHDMYVRMISLGAKMLARYRVRVVLMVMKAYVGLPRAHIARLYSCSCECVRKAIVAAREIAKANRDVIWHDKKI